MDDEFQKFARYLNDLRSGIHDEISFEKLDSVEEAYQYALKAKEILKKKHKKNRGRSRSGRFQRDCGRFYVDSGRTDNFV